MSHMKSLVAACLASIALAPTSLAETTAITNAHILTMGPDGEIQNGTIVFDEDEIVSIGTNVRIPSDAKMIDAQGQTVMPGFIMTGTSLGISNLPSYGSLDDSSTNNPYVTAAYDVQYALNPDDPQIVVAKSEGVTGALVTPDLWTGSAADPRMFAGTSASVALAEDENMILRTSAGIVMVAGTSGASKVGGGRPSEIALFRSALKEARAYTKSRKQELSRSAISLGLSPLDLEALARVADRKEPLLVDVHNAADILNMIDIAKAEGIDLVLLGASEGWTVADQIAAANIPVIVDPEANVPSDLSSKYTTNENAARLIAAGVKVGFKAVHGRPFWYIRSPRSVVGRLVGYTDLSYGDALIALTIHGAEIAGIADQTGSLEKGKRADIVIWDGDPLEAMSHPTYVFINGIEQNITTRGELLGKRYIEIARKDGVLH